MVLAGNLFGTVRPPASYGAITQQAPSGESASAWFGAAPAQAPSLSQMLEEFASSPGSTILNLTTIAITVGAVLSFLPNTGDVGQHVQIVSCLICGIYGAAASLVALNIIRPFRSHMSETIGIITSMLAVGAANTLFALDGVSRIANVVGQFEPAITTPLFPLLLTVSLCFGAGMAYFSIRIEIDRSPIHNFFENMAVSFTTGALLGELGRAVQLSGELSDHSFRLSQTPSSPFPRASTQVQIFYQTCVLAIQWLAFAACVLANNPTTTSLLARVVSPVNGSIAQVNVLLSAILNTAEGRFPSILISCINMVLHGVSFGAPHDHPSLAVLSGRPRMV